MFGSIYRMHPKPGKEMDIADQFRRWDRERRSAVPGAVAGYLFRPKSAPDELIGFAVFDSEANYRRNAEDPAQDEWYRGLRQMLEADPEWNDGDILVAL
jgi:heme-degrading monooxygenase HmoA